MKGRRRGRKKDEEKQGEDKALRKGKVKMAREGGEWREKGDGGESIEGKRRG